jgi:hypothetical protein
VVYRINAMMPTMISAQNNTIPITMPVYPHPLMSWSDQNIMGTSPFSALTILCGQPV